MSDERGSVTLWMVGMMLVVMAVGGIAIDLWRGLSTHRQLASVVDAAAIAAGSGIDEERWRFDGELRLDPDAVRSRVAAAVDAQPGVPTFVVNVVTAADGTEATVTAETTVSLTLLGLLVEDDIAISARATAIPALSP